MCFVDLNWSMVQIQKIYLKIKLVIHLKTEILLVKKLLMEIKNHKTKNCN